MAKHSLKSLPAMNVLLSSFQKGFRPTMATSGSLHHHKHIPGKHRHCLPTCSAYRGGQEFSVGFSEMSLPLLIRPGLSLLGLPVEPVSPHSVSFFKAHNRLHGLQQEPSLMLPVSVRCPFSMLWIQLVSFPLSVPTLYCPGFCY